MAQEPIHTRLRWVSSKDPQALQDFLEGLGFRVKIYSINFDGKKWFAFFVPPDRLDLDIKSGSLD